MLSSSNCFFRSSCCCLYSSNFVLISSFSCSVWAIFSSSLRWSSAFMLFFWSSWYLSSTIFSADFKESSCSIFSISSILRVFISVSLVSMISESFSLLSGVFSLFLRSSRAWFNCCIFYWDFCSFCWWFWISFWRFSRFSWVFCWICWISVYFCWIESSSCWRDCIFWREDWWDWVRVSSSCCFWARFCSDSWSFWVRF